MRVTDVQAEQKLNKIYIECIEIFRFKDKDLLTKTCKPTQPLTLLWRLTVLLSL